MFCNYKNIFIYIENGMCLSLVLAHPVSPLGRLEKSIRLDMCLNFDQVWKQSWGGPKKVYIREFETDVAMKVLSSKKRKICHHLETLQDHNRNPWAFKKKRIIGEGSAESMLKVCFHIIPCNISRGR